MLKKILSKLNLGILFFIACNINAQNSMIGDGFGGRLWYSPTNYSVGSYSGYSVCGDSNQLFGWGDNSKGQLGNGNKTSTILAVKAIGMTNVKFYTCGYYMAVIKKDNTGWVWGSEFGSTPIKVIDNVKFVDAGEYNVSFVKNDGTVWSLGNNLNNEFGLENEKILFSKIPVKMQNINSAARVAISNYFIYILLKNGSIMVSGKISALNNKLPILIDNIKNVLDIKANNYNVIALDISGNLYNNKNGEYTAFKYNNIKNIVAISACCDGYSFLALDQNFNCYGWGDNSYGQLAYKKENKIQEPLKISENVIDILSGETFTYIVKKDNTLWACGASKPGYSIWMNLTNIRRDDFFQIDPTDYRIQICPTKYILNANQTITLCDGDSLKISNKYYKKSGIYYDTTRINFNTVHVTKIIVKIVKKTTFKQTFYICESDYIIVNKNKYNKFGTYIDKVINHLGCDSIIITNILKNVTKKDSMKYNLCNGDTLKINNISYYHNGIYYDTFKSKLGCETIYKIKIKIISKSFSVQNISICENQIFNIGGNTYSKSGIYLDTFTNYHGCDSILTTILKVNSKSYFNQKITLCYNQSYKTNNHICTTNGIYLDTLINYLGCDSIVTTNLIINPL